MEVEAGVMLAAMPQSKLDSAGARLQFGPGDPAILAGENYHLIAVMSPLMAPKQTFRGSGWESAKLGVNRRPANVAVKGRQLLMQVSHDLRYFWIDPAQQMAFRNTPFEIEEVKQLALIATLPTHHDPPPPLNESSKRELQHADNHDPFSTASTQVGSRAVEFAVMRNATPACMCYGVKSSAWESP
jgi:hypothetical protein